LLPVQAVQVLVYFVLALEALHMCIDPTQLFNLYPVMLILLGLDVVLEELGDVDLKGRHVLVEAPLLDILDLHLLDILPLG